MDCKYVILSYTKIRLNFYIILFADDNKLPAGRTWTAKYLGCFKNIKNKKVLSKAYVQIKKNSMAACIKHCLNAGYILAGLENGKKCFCSSRIPKGAKLIADKQ